MNIADASPASVDTMVKTVGEQIHVAVRGLATCHAIRLLHPLFLEGQAAVEKIVAQAL